MLGRCCEGIDGGSRAFGMWILNSDSSRRMLVGSDLV